MRRLAAAMMRSERPGHSLQPTALVHEAYIRLVGGTRVDWQDRAHFIRVAARAMRRILVDHARRRASQKAGGGQERVTIERAVGLGVGPEIEVLELDDVLGRLATLDARMAHGVELRVFGGLNAQEIATVLGVSERTVRNDWTMAKAWLARELSRDA
jgi:RNA polymerase sigma factor (TIGR02999 family)